MQEKKKTSWFDIAKTLVWALILASVFRTAIYDPYHIPSGSMLPTLLVGDFVVVSKFSYGYSKHSFWPVSLDLFDDRVLYTIPERGDVAVFKVPGKGFGKDVYIKRIVGLPGDAMQMKGGVLYINDKMQEQFPAGDFQDLDKDETITQAVEILDNGVEHYILDKYDDTTSDNTKIFTVPVDSFFVMGDNRDNSKDSRFASPGFISKENLIGRAEIVLFSSRGMIWNPLEWRYDRFFERLYN